MPLSESAFGSPAMGPRLTRPGLGLGASEHALLGAVVELPDSGGVVLTGRLSPATQSWLTDHAVDGMVVFPGAGFVELAIRAGDEVGCATVDELNLQSPLMLPASGSVAVQVVVGAADESGQRSLSVFARDDSGFRMDCHATGILSSGPVEPAADLSVWPPEGAVAVDVTDGYQRLAERGYQYGPAFQGLTALWRRGDEFFAEVTLPQAAGGVTGFGVHPVLLDAALHAAAVTQATVPVWHCRSLGRACRCMRRERRRCGRGSRRRARRRCRWNWPTGWGCRC